MTSDVANYKRVSVTKGNAVLSLLTCLFVYDTMTYINPKYSFYLSVALSAGFIFFTSLIGFRWIFEKKQSLWLVITFASFILFFLNGTPKIWTTYVAGALRIFFWPNVMCFLAKNFSKKQIARFTATNLVILLLSIALTINALNIYPLAARALYGKTNDLSDNSFLFDLGCGGYGFIYGLVFVSTGFVVNLKEKVLSKRVKILAMIYLILCYYTIVRAEFSTGILISIISAIMVRFYTDKRPYRFLVICGLLTITIFSNMSLILSWIGDFAEKSNLSILTDKVGLISTALQTGSVSSLSRATRYSMSIEGFLSNPIIGSGMSGTHSQMLDTLSYLGIFGIPYIVLFFTSFNRYKLFIQKKYCQILLFAAAILAVFNPFVDMTLIALVMLLCPCIIYLGTDELFNTKMAH